MSSECGWSLTDGLLYLWLSTSSTDTLQDHFEGFGSYRHEKFIGIVEFLIKSLPSMGIIAHPHQKQTNKMNPESPNSKRMGRIV